MATKTSQNSQTAADTAMLLAGMAAAWLAAGSTGMLAHPLRHALTWIALATAIVAAWPEEIRQIKSWSIFALCLILGLSFTMSSLPAVNVLAVAVVLAAIAQINEGHVARTAAIASLAATVLGCFRLACSSIPIVWHAADWIGWLLGGVAGWLAGNRLNVGATFGGVDFLVLAAAIYVAWIIHAPTPRKLRAFWAAAAIIFGQLAYLIVLANSEKLLAHLPETVAPLEQGNNHVGLWTLSNGLRTLIPWNLPLLAMVFQGLIVAVMVRSAPWRAALEPAGQIKEGDEDVTGAELALDMVFHFGPALLAVAAALLSSLTIAPADLGGKKVVAYRQGHRLEWQKPEYDSDADGYYGLLPEFVESLGGKFSISNDLSERDLAEADVLLLIHPDRPWLRETLGRIQDYVRRGGSLLVVGEQAVRWGDSQSAFNEALEPLAMRVRFDTAVPLAAGWEQSYDISPHPAAFGLNDRRNPFGMQTGSSIAAGWLADPIFTGRWGWSDPGNTAALSGYSSYDAGERLGDLILAAEQPFGRGRVVVLGDTAPLHNENLAGTYPFVGRLLSYMANRPSSPTALWRQLAALAALAGMIALLVCRPSVWQLMLVPSLLGVALIWCSAAGYWSARVMPDGRRGELNNLAYIDASHLESFSGDTWSDGGLAGLLRTLMRHGYLPLYAPDLMPERLERCGLLISIGPGRGFSTAERAAIREFVEDGGTMICLVGAEDVRPSASLLADFGIRVPHSPVPPGENFQEPFPLGADYVKVSDDMDPFRLYAAWPVETIGERAMGLVQLPGKDWSYVAKSSRGNGNFVVIGDTHFAANENLESAEGASTETIRFWRWLLSRVVPGQTEWNPPAEISEQDVDMQ